MALYCPPYCKPSFYTSCCSNILTAVSLLVALYYFTSIFKGKNTIIEMANLEKYQVHYR